jgi:hypothetical protein
VEQPVLGSAGGPRHALRCSPSRRPPLIVNADTLCTVDLHGLLARRASAGGTMARSPADPLKCGGVKVPEGYVTGFARAGTRWSFHFVGVQAAEARAFAALETACRIGERAHPG